MCEGYLKCGIVQGIEDIHGGFHPIKRWTSLLRWVEFGCSDEVVVWAFGRLGILKCWIGFIVLESLSPSMFVSLMERYRQTQVNLFLFSIANLSIFHLC
jgi:hypothetical protein